MNIKKKLAHPFALVAQGFGLGAILVFATATPEADSPPQPRPVQAASVPQVPSA